MKLLIFALLAEISAVLGNLHFTKGNNLFASDIYKMVAAEERGNFVVSPFSAETVLAVVQTGAKGTTLQELQKVTRIRKPVTIPDLESANHTLLLANKIYVKGGFTLNEKFVDEACDNFLMEVENIDFQDGAVERINGWVQEQTDNKFQNLIGPGDLDEETTVVLVSALYFQGNWSLPFLLAATQKADFYKKLGKLVEVDTMYSKESYEYYRCPYTGAELLALPFQGDIAKMVIILPSKEGGLTQVEARIGEALGHKDDVFVRRLVELTLPKFKTESAMDFTDILKKLGVSRLFRRFEADLSGMAGGLHVDKVVQKARIEVSEEGVEAAAATLIYLEQPQRADLRKFVSFVVDRPFIFYVKIKDVVVFVGRITDPDL